MDKRDKINSSWALDLNRYFKMDFTKIVLILDTLLFTMEFGEWVILLNIQDFSLIKEKHLDIFKWSKELLLSDNMIFLSMEAKTL